MVRICFLGSNEFSIGMKRTLMFSPMLEESMAAKASS